MRIIKDALKNQQESIDIQKRALRRQKIVLIVRAVMLALFLGIMALSSHA